MAEQTPTESVAAALAVAADHSFQLLMKRFDRIEEQNDAQLQLMNAHIEKDDKAHKILERHTAYFSVMSFGTVPILGWLAYKLGLKP